MQKTVVVAVDYVVWRPKLKVYEKRTAKHFAHDEGQECNIGDTVRIRWTPRRSKHKHYAVEERLRTADVFSAATANQGAAQSQAGISQAALAEAQLSQAKLRLQRLQQELQQLRASYDQDEAAAALVGGGSCAAGSSGSSSSSGGDGGGGGGSGSGTTSSSSQQQQHPGGGPFS
jgi:small subunit ribosomal protein S17